jgi:hypothetical protein
VEWIAPTPTPTATVTPTVTVTPTITPSSTDPLDGSFYCLSTNESDSCRCVGDSVTITVYDADQPIEEGEILYKVPTGIEEWTFTELQTLLGTSNSSLYISSTSNDNVVEIVDNGMNVAIANSVSTCPTPTPTPTTTVTPTVTPTITPSSTTNCEFTIDVEWIAPTPTPTPTNTVTPTSTLTPTPTITPTVTVTPTITPTNTVTPTPTLTPTPTVPAILATVSVVSNVSCNGGSDGSISVSGITGGYGGPYSTKLNSDGTYQVIVSSRTYSNLTAGTYTIYVKDSQGIERLFSITVTQPTVLTSSITSTTDPTVGGSDGSITVTSTGGTWPKTYKVYLDNSFPYTSCNDGTLIETITNVTESTAERIISDLVEGGYCMEVTDANGCIVSSGITVLVDGGA